jgi:hypothetical protein
MRIIHDKIVRSVAPQHHYTGRLLLQSARFYMRLHARLQAKAPMQSGKPFIDAALLKAGLRLRGAPVRSRSALAVR